MNMLKVGIVSCAVALCRDTINNCIYKELNLIRYTLCEVDNTQPRNRNRNGFGFYTSQIIPPTLGLLRSLWEYGFYVIPVQSLLGWTAPANASKYSACGRRIFSEKLETVPPLLQKRTKSEETRSGFRFRVRRNALEFEESRPSKDTGLIETASSFLFSRNAQGSEELKTSCSAGLLTLTLTLTLTLLLLLTLTGSAPQARKRAAASGSASGGMLLQSERQRVTADITKSFSERSEAAAIPAKPFLTLALSRMGCQPVYKWLLAIFSMNLSQPLSCKTVFDFRGCHE